MTKCDGCIFNNTCVNCNDFDCRELEFLLKEHDKQIKADVIEEYSSKLWKAIERATVNCKLDLTIDDLHNIENVIKVLAEQLKGKLSKTEKN